MIDFLSDDGRDGYCYRPSPEKIPKAVKEICDCCEKKPSVVMICITCVDALLGTDMERVCRKAEEKVDIPVRPCYMYALTREGRSRLWSMCASPYIPP